MQKVPLTVTGAELLKGELQRLKSVERPTVIAAIAEARQQHNSVEAEFAGKVYAELADTQRQIVGLEQELIKAEQRTDLQTLAAPIAGIVQQLAVHTVGGVVTPAQPLMVIVPKDNVTPLDARATDGCQFVCDAVGIDDGDALRRETRRRRTLAAADAAGQPDNETHSVVVGTAGGSSGGNGGGAGFRASGGTMRSLSGATCCAMRSGSRPPSPVPSRLCPQKNRTTLASSRIRNATRIELA